MEIFVIKQLSDDGEKTFTLELELSDTIKNIKGKIQEKEGILPRDYYMYYFGQLMVDKQDWEKEDEKDTLSYYINENFGDFWILENFDKHIEISTRSFQLFIENLTGETRMIEATPSATTESIKEKMIFSENYQTLQGIPASVYSSPCVVDRFDEFRLIFGRSTLQNGRTLWDYRISKEYDYKKHGSGVLIHEYGTGMKLMSGLNYCHCPLGPKELEKIRNLLEDHFKCLKDKNPEIDDENTRKQILGICKTLQEEDINSMTRRTLFKDVLYNIKADNNLGHKTDNENYEQIYAFTMKCLSEEHDAFLRTLARYFENGVKTYKMETFVIKHHYGVYPDYREKTFTLELELSDTIYKIQDKIQEKEGIPPRDYSMSYCGQLMEDPLYSIEFNTLSYYINKKFGNSKHFPRNIVISPRRLPKKTTKDECLIL